MLDLKMGKGEKQIRVKMQGNKFIDNCFFVRPVNKMQRLTLFIHFKLMTGICKADDTRA